MKPSLNRTEAEENRPLLSQNKTEPIHLSFHNVSFSVKVKKETKVLLDNINGWAKPGEILAIMGASGAGKTTLMNLLAQRLSTKGTLTGQILFNEKQPPRKMGSISGYVMQDDLFLGALTVKETLFFRSKLVLGANATRKEIDLRIEKVLDELSLKKCADSRIGNTIVRGISGGEKKRVNIGVELISQPPLLFLDEPTSGLDSFTSYNVMEILGQIASNQRTVVCTIHQPRSNIFTLFDKILLLSEGKTVYFGSAKESVSYFEKAGYPCPLHMNPSDFFLDTISVDYRSEEIALESKKRLDHLVGVFEQEMKFPDPILSKTVYHVAQDYPSGFFRQLLVLTHRNFFVILRSYESTLAGLIQSLVLGVIIGLIFLQMGVDQKSIQGRQGLLFLVIVQQGFTGLFSALVLFQQEKEIFYQERRAGLYQVSSFFISKFLTEIPLALLKPFLFGVVVYFMSGLQATVEKFFIFILTLCLTTLSSQGMGFAISTGAPSIRVANMLAPLFIVILFLFGGFFANLDNIPVYFVWLEYLSFIKWGFEVLCYNEFTGLVFECPPTGICAYPTGEAVLEFLSMENVSIPINSAILIGIGAIFQLIAYLFLRFLRK